MPVHNEQACVARAIERVPDFVDLIVAVDDGSTDESLSTLSRITDSRVTLLRHESNRGVGAATKTGYRYCLAGNFELIAVMDGDGQMDGRDLPRLLNAVIDGAEYVKGNRFLDKETIARMPLRRYLGNRVFSWLTRLTASFNESLDAHCGYTAIRRDSLARLDLDELYDRYGFPTEMFFAARRAGLRIESVPVRSVYGDEISGLNPFTVVPTILWLMLRNYLRERSRAKT
ncbi:MAG TPA: glycosyltransferase family 2 protein [Blastocatellia bacterium]|nr:glycosyltransferase family 2 protein [Blastocatellia bacterium]